MEHTTNITLLWPLLFYGFAVILLVGGMLGVSYFLGERHNEKATSQPFESGVIPTGSARLHFPIHFYVVSMFFVVFDLEAVFVFTWAISIRETGWPGYIIILVFIAELLILLFYLWKIGAMDFGPNTKAILKAYHKKTKTN
ncbi:NADH-quinone oxidoreductase subunit A [Gelidibacter sp.]|uniref:NADH-quinone oxidoreductase subunit A n=1 Tax=Gelidibacter sp. TaxID=2018083 RepID=UPI00326537E6